MILQVSRFKSAYTLRLIAIGGLVLSPLRRSHLIAVCLEASVLCMAPFSIIP